MKKTENTRKNHSFNTTALLRLSIIFFLFSLLFSCEESEDGIKPDVMAIKAIGTSTAAPMTQFIQAIGQEVSGNTFEVDFYDTKNGNKLGKLQDIVVGAETFEDGSMTMENYTIFTFYEDNSTLVLYSIIDTTPLDATTMKATIAEENAMSNVVGGTGRYRNVRGGCKLDAILDVTLFGEGTVGFECYYDITINPAHSL